MSITAPPLTADLTQLLAALQERGITLCVHGEKLRYHPREAVTEDLLEQMKTHKRALLGILQGDGPPDKTPASTGPPLPDSPKSGVSSVLSVSEQRGVVLWSEEERALLARASLTATDMQRVETVKSVFANDGATVVAVEPWRPWGRRRAAELIRSARWVDQTIGGSRAIMLREAWRERIAICMIDGGQTLEEAEKIALNELEKIVHYEIS